MTNTSIFLDTTYAWSVFHPLGRASCECCGRESPANDLRKGAFGDLVCARCADADSEVYFDFFGRAEG